MQPEILKQHEGKKCRIVLRNNYNYTGIIPKIKSDTLTLKDKFGNLITINCGDIMVVEELGDRYG